MAIGLVGRKQGMTRIFNEAGESIPVSVIEVCDNRVTMVKTLEKDGYSAVQVTYGNKKPTHVTKPEAGVFAKANMDAGVKLVEFRLDDVQGDALQSGSKIGLDIFTEVSKVDVTGVSKGKSNAMIR